jgi:ABC-type uncharacterized transport system involved in gliding motility auxiliary subunit
MKTDPRRFAPLGLVLSLLALLTFIGFVLVRGISTTGLALAVDKTILDRGLLISGLTIILGLAMTAILDPEATRKFLVGRQMQYGSNSVILLLAFIGVLIFVNVLAYQNPKSWDLTENKSNTLATETLNTLAALPEPVVANAYYTSRTSTDTVRKLLENFKQNSKGKFSYAFTDPEANLVAAQADGVERDATIVLHLGEHKEQVVAANEQDLVSAMVRLLNPENRVVYFVTGHGEPEIENSGDQSYSMAKATLEKKNYTVKPLGLLAEGKVPADAKVVIIAGPKTPLAAEEVQALDKYLSNGGAVIVMEAPTLLTKFGAVPDTLAPLLAKWGLALDDDIVIDPNANPVLVAVADTAAYAPHPITDKMLGQNSYYPRARSVKTGTVEGVSITPLVTTNTNAWGETDFKSIDNNQIAFDAATDIAGPVTLAAAAENTATKGRLVVFGNVEFPFDAYYRNGNGDILINAVDWAAAQEDIISLTPKETNSRKFNPPGTLGLIGIILTSICIIPLLVIAGGLAAWYSRRRRG